MANPAEKFLNPRELEDHNLAKERQKEYLRRTQEGDSKVSHIEDLGSKPVPEEIRMEATRINEILDEIVSTINNKGLLPKQRVELAKGKLDKRVSDGLDILKDHKENPDSSANEVRNTFIKKKMIDDFILGK